MKLKELNEQVAKACDTTTKQVAAVQAETFRLIAGTLEKGERVFVPEFGVFSVKDVEGTEGQPGKKIVRFRQRSNEDGAGEEEGAKETGKERKKRAKKEAAEAEPAEAAE